jgi:hypothetical protein
MTVPTDTAVETVRRAALMSSVFNHLKENRIEYAVFTLLVYSLDLVSKVTTHAQSICV